MRRCFSCGESKDLKSIFVEDCDCHFNSYDFDVNHSVCSNCFFEICACGLDMHLSSDCLEDKSCENHDKTMAYYKYWGNYDYNWESRKELRINN